MPPAWAKIEPPACSEARDLDGDGFVEGIHLAPGERGANVIVVDVRGLATRVFATSQVLDASALTAVSHTGCGYVFTPPAPTE